MSGEIAGLDQELAACRDANGLLTARMVAGEIRERVLRQQLEDATERIDRLEYTLSLYHDTTKQLSDALIECHGLTEQVQQRLTAKASDGDA